MSEHGVPEGVDPETGEVLSDDEQAEVEEAESEAEAAETDSDEPGSEAADENDAPAPEDSSDEPAPNAGEAEIEKNTKALNRASQSYIKKVVDTLGPELEGMQTCPLCAEYWPGLRFPVMPDPVHLAEVRVAIGLEPGDHLPKDNYSRPCAACEGWGRVDTGSKVPAQASATCYDCQGRGWVPVGDERKSGSVTAGNGHTDAPTFNAPTGGTAEPPEAEGLRSLGWIVVPPPVVEPAATP